MEEQVPLTSGFTGHVHLKFRQNLPSLRFTKVFRIFPIDVNVSLSYYRLQIPVLWKPRRS
jgi:hypothetical protein